MMLCSPLPAQGRLGVDASELEDEECSTEKDHNETDAALSAAPTSETADDTEGSFLPDGHEPATARRGSLAQVEPETAKLEKLATVAVNLNGCCYDVVGEACRSLGWKITAHEDRWIIRWVDRYCLGQTLRDMRLNRPQRINHFPAICEIAFKCRLANNLNKMRQRLPDDYAFYPQTWVLPEEFGVLDRTIAENPNRTYIVKPNNGSQGQGIFFTRRAGDIPKEGKFVAQRYLNKPLLIDKLKFDLRIYVLITSVFPLRIFVAREGLARFCTEPYEGINKQNRGNQFKHLTNYAINKKNDAFQAPKGPENDSEEGGWGDFEANGLESSEQARKIVDSGGSKRALTSIYAWLDSNGFRSDIVKRDIHEVIVKTILSALPANQHAYKVSFPESRDSVGASCFTVLGFDVMLDADAKVWLIETNELPSFETDTALDYDIKMSVIRGALEMVCPCFEETRLLKEITASLQGGPGPQKSKRDEKRDQWRRDTRHQILQLRVKHEYEHSGAYEQVFPASDPQVSCMIL